MPSRTPADDDDWSDSDDEGLSDVETAVQLGLPDGALASPVDLRDAAVSRIGGLPAFLAREPPPDTAHCKSCAQPMPLLIQVWCPLEGSAFDRALYVWACAAGACQRKPGSVRAWRALRYNEKYAQKLARKQEKKEDARRRAEAEAAKQKGTQKANPFSLKTANPSNPFDLGTQVFGNAPAPAPPSNSGRESPLDAAQSDESGEDGESDAGESDEDLASALAVATLEDSQWRSAPAYAPLYLSTVAEYLPPAPKRKVPAGADADDADDDERRGKAAAWALEGYENSLAVDHAFERFSARVAHEGAQCLRYERGGIPLPFASDSVFDALFPAPPAPPAPVTKAAFAVAAPSRRTYAPGPAAVPACAHCGAARVFECQTMPNLINVLKQEGVEAPPADEARRQAVLAALEKGRAEGRVGMEWGTCMVFACERDCATVEREGGWREELVLVQWDD